MKKKIEEKISKNQTNQTQEQDFDEDDPVYQNIKNAFLIEDWVLGSDKPKIMNKENEAL